MSALIGYALTAGGAICALLIGIAWLWLRPSGHGPRRWLAAAAIVYTLTSIHAVVRVLSAPLLVGLSPFAPTPGQPTPAIVVLGGGVNTVPGREAKIAPLSRSSAARVLEGARVYHATNASWVISSGGPGPDPDWVPEAEPMRDALVALGVPASRILLEPRSATTHEQSLLVEPMLRSLHAETFVLVTSDIHMRRSLGAFRARGLRPIPAIARDPYDTLSPMLKVVPTFYGLESGSGMVHEYVGLAYYFARGWI